MRIPSNSTLAAAMLSLLSATVETTPSNAGMFEFSYTFDTSDIISGTFTGNEKAGLITDIDNITMRLDGIVLDGPFHAKSYTAPGYNCILCWQDGGAIVSYNPMLNNFGFLSYGDNYKVFYIIPWPNGTNNPVAVTYHVNNTGYYIDYYNGNFIANNWKLTAIQETSAPEPSTWAMSLIGFGMLGYYLTRRSLATARA